MTLLDGPQKSDVIRSYAERYPDHRTFIETGTAFGDQCLALADVFDRIISIEFLDTHFEAARERTAHLDNVEVLLGDSGRLIEGVLAAWDGPAIIFLDAHEVVDNGSAAMNAEMNRIAKDIAITKRRHVVLIDDIRLCNGKKGWTTPGLIKEWADIHGYHFEVTDDIARLTP